MVICLLKFCQIRYKLTPLIQNLKGTFGEKHIIFEQTDLKMVFSFGNFMFFWGMIPLIRTGGQAL